MIWIELGLPCGNVGGWQSTLARVAVAAALHHRAPRRRWANPVGVPSSVDASRSVGIVASMSEYAFL
jgi:hypothetical protein